MTTSPDAAAGLRSEAAEDALLAGDGDRVRRLAAEVLAGPAPASARARVRSRWGPSRSCPGRSRARRGCSRRRPGTGRDRCGCGPWASCSSSPTGWGAPTSLPTWPGRWSPTRRPATDSPPTPSGPP